MIDNIFTNDPLRPSISGLFVHDISDHLPIFSLILYNDSTSDKDKYVFLREKNVNNLSAFKDELGQINWAGMRGDYRQNLMLYYAVLL